MGRFKHHQTGAATWLSWVMRAAASALESCWWAMRSEPVARWIEGAPPCRVRPGSGNHHREFTANPSPAVFGGTGTLPAETSTTHIFAIWLSGASQISLREMSCNMIIGKIGLILWAPSWHFSGLLREVAAEKRIETGKIEQSPMEGLISYYA